MKETAYTISCSYNAYLPWLYGLNPLGVELKNPFGVGNFDMLRCIDWECESPVKLCICIMQ